MSNNLKIRIMETKKSILIEFVKSNKSNAMVWKVSVPKSKKNVGYCKTAAKAIMFAFLLKSRTQLPIDKYCLDIAQLAIPAKTTEPPKAE